MLLDFQGDKPRVQRLIRVLKVTEAFDESGLVVWVLRIQILLLVGQLLSGSVVGEGLAEINDQRVNAIDKKSGHAEGGHESTERGLEGALVVHAQLYGLAEQIDTAKLLGQVVLSVLAFWHKI